MRRIAIVLISLLILISLDLGSKFFAQYFFVEAKTTLCINGKAVNSHPFTTLPRYCDSSYVVEIIPGIFQLKLSHNTGIAFSLPITGLPLQIITIIIVIGLIWYYFREEYPKRSYLLDAGYTLVIAGALSHTYERIFVGHVIDFIAVKYFAIMNFADIFISIGAFLIILSYVFPRKHR